MRRAGKSTAEEILECCVLFFCKDVNVHVWGRNHAHRSAHRQKLQTCSNGVVLRQTKYLTSSKIWMGKKKASFGCPLMDTRPTWQCARSSCGPFVLYFCFCAVFSCVLFHNVIGCSPQKMEKKTLLAAPKNRPVFGPNNGLKSLKPPCLCLFCFGPFSGAVFRTDFWGPHGTVCMRRSQTRIDPMCDCIV